jgi:DNA polymerase-3 subunit alpha
MPLAGSDIRASHRYVAAVLFCYTGPHHLRMTHKPFTHLHTHSHYSLLQALPQIPDLVKAAKDDGQTALALTDAGNLYGAIDFYKECTKQGLKPIIGVDAFVAPRTRHDKEHRIDDHTTRLVLLAKNIDGYHNLIKLVTKANLEGFYYNPRIDRELIEEYRDGLIAILPSFGGEVARALQDEQKEKADESLSWYRGIFSDDLFIEITRHDEFPGHEERMQKLIALARSHSVPLVAAHDTYYLNKDDAVARELVYKIKTGGRLDRDEERAEDFSFITEARANELFKDLPEALENTQKIVAMCSLELQLGKWFFPNFPIPAGSTHDAELRQKAYAGFASRNIQQDKETTARVDYELAIIAKKGYSPYFLVVADLLQAAARMGIFTNTRGSAAGSLVSYLCGITTVNPLEYNLPFERFLNPERPSPPDIDMDIADNRRDDLIDYARQKYGEDHVAQIGTFGTMLSRAAVRDVARALGYSYAVGDQIAKIIPPPKQGFPVTIESAMRDVPELKEVYDTNPDAHEILDLAQKIEGNARHVGVHAAGVVIAPTPVTDFVPTQLDPKGGKIITQYDMHAVEDAGLLKYDFLGLKNLAVLADSVGRVKRRLTIDIDIVNLPLDDSKTYEMLARGETLGVFQMASDGMTKYLVELEPTEIHDLNAMVALYRPGPMAFIPDYIARKKNPALINYLDPRMESILNRSYGIITYQDDVLMIAIDLAGYSWLEADKFRKAIGKKIPEEMAKQKEHFTTGCIERGMKTAIVKQLWEQIETFAAYGFNKAHAASYGNLAYKTAYMKANYPEDFMAALLTADSGDVEEVGRVVAECRRIGIEVLPPDVNYSREDFTVSGEKAIRFGLTSIKNFGAGIAHSIAAERDASGPFQSLGDFLSRIKDKNLNRKSLESLIKTGALDTLGERGAMLMHIETLLSYHKEHMASPEDQDSLFGTTAAPEVQIPKSAPATKSERLEWEKELLGLYISGHPLDLHKDVLGKQKLDIKGVIEKVPADTLTNIAGLVSSVRVILTKSGEKMAFVALQDFSGTLESVFFPRTFKDAEAIVQPGRCIVVRGRLSPRNGEQSFVAESAKAL